MELELGVLLAAGSSLFATLAFFLKHRGASSVPAVHMRRPWCSIRDLFTNRFFACGMGVAAVAWVLHVGAMAVAPLTVVQVVLAAGVVLIAVVADRLFGMPVGPRQLIGLLLTAGGLALLVLTLPGAEGTSSSFAPAELLTFEVALLALSGLLALGPRAGVPAHLRGPLLGIAAGVLFGVSNVAIKALTGAVGDEDPSVLVVVWLALTLLASVTAFFASARSLQNGPPVAVIALTGTAANVAAIAGGIVVFGDPLPDSAQGLALGALGMAAVLLAAALIPGPAAAAEQPA